MRLSAGDTTILGSVGDVMGRAVGLSRREKKALNDYADSQLYFSRHARKVSGTYGILVKILYQQFVEGQIVGLDEALDVRPDCWTGLVVDLPL